VFVSYAAKSSYAEANPHFRVDAALVLRYALVLGWRTRFAVAGVDQTNCRSQFQAVTQHWTYSQSKS